ncbi:MAG: hypothetical protein ACSI46_15075 [Gloeotrichia echinulata DVL01]|jgi:hypothetical protein|nr:hypothetical protein [Gloeotrichia echinulata DEX184]
MPWWSRSTANEMGDYLPDDQATLQEEQIRVQGKNEQEAREKCREEASQYDAVESDVEPTKDDNTWNCKFKFWG